MSNTLRFFVNDKRVSTAVLLKDESPSVLQVYPVKRRFADQAAWQKWWTENSCPSLRVEGLSAPAPKVTAAPPSSPVSPKKKSPPAVKESDWAHRECSSFTAPPGKYYIGDLCYVLGDDVYDTIFGGLGGYDSGLYQEKGTDRFFFVDGTAYGDGLYHDSTGREYGVDAGIIGICPASLMDKDDGGGQMHEFTEPVVCKFKGGVFKFTSAWTRLTINTQGDDEEE
jgi:hypothetical protein